MLYITHYKYKQKYYETQQRYNQILSEKEKLFTITQPKGTDFSKERVKGGEVENTFDKYLILKEEKNIDQQLAEVKSILQDRKELVTLKEEELRHSKVWADKIYTYRYIDNLKVKKIITLVPFEDAQVYRILRTIKNNLK